MKRLEIVYKNLTDLIPYAKNPRRNDQTVDSLAAAIEEYGFKVPIIIDENNEIVAGHTRLKAAKKLNLSEVPVIIADDLSEKQVRAFRLLDNRLSEMSEWDEDLLSLELTALKAVDMDLSIFGLEPPKLDDIEAKDIYTDKVEIPHYQITDEQPSIDTLLDDQKAKELIQEIKQHNLPSEVRDFLVAAASRHLVFDYGNIAEFYAHADAEVQELFEKSALVIVDFDNAIADGYVRLNQTLDELRDADG